VSKWQQISVELKGEDVPVIVQTTAMDWAPVRAQAGADSQPVDMLFQVAHNALRRIGHPVPRDYRGFLEVLDGMPETLEEADPDEARPTGEDH
jgi:hypothetical protein